MTTTVTVVSTSSVATSSSALTTSLPDYSTVFDPSPLVDTSVLARSSVLPVAPHNNCHHNNCLPQFIRHPQVSAFCATYTTTINTATANLPDYVSQCHADPTRISSACSCIVTGGVVLTQTNDGTFTTRTATCLLPHRLSIQACVWKASSTRKSLKQLHTLSLLPDRP